MRKLVAFIIIVQACSFVLRASACTAFTLADKDSVIVAKSYDWFFGHGHGALFVNPRGISREALQFKPSLVKPAQWRSRFGSVTMTQFGRGLPISGMNEKGLVVELLQLEVSRYNSLDVSKPFVNESQWAQWQLDHYSDVADVLAHVHELRIEQAFTGIHYFIADRSGKTAVVEFLNGRLLVRAAELLPIAALTNDPYDASLDYVSKQTAVPPTTFRDRLSEVRFHTTQRMIASAANLSRDKMIPFAWQLLGRVRLNGFAKDAMMEPTQWNIVHDLTAGIILFKTRRSPTLKTLKLSDLDFSEGAPELMVDMNAAHPGDLVRQLHCYSSDQNAKLIRRNSGLFWLMGESDKIERAVEFGAVATPACSP